MEGNRDSLSFEEATTTKKEINENQWHEIKNTPFYAVGNKKDGYTICLAGCAVSPIKFERISKAIEFVSKKPWDLLLVSTAIYNERIQEIKAERSKKICANIENI